MCLFNLKTFYRDLKLNRCSIDKKSKKYDFTQQHSPTPLEFKTSVTLQLIIIAEKHRGSIDYASRNWICQFLWNR